MHGPSCSRARCLCHDSRILKAASDRCGFDSPSRNRRTLSRTHPPAMRHDVRVPFSARYLVQSSKRVQSCDSTSVRRISRRSGIRIELRSIRACLMETERDMVRNCGLPRAKDSKPGRIKLCHETSLVEMGGCATSSQACQALSSSPSLNLTRAFSSPTLIFFRVEGFFRVMDDPFCAQLQGIACIQSAISVIICPLVSTVLIAWFHCHPCHWHGE